ncbi:nuclear transport factor 2 family protein [Microbacterium lushaniae]|nr:nuclear transport factor 2 family protein [Microbacterium lushaniae]KAA9150598.1 nuclear transport factor 2 family protein [Microbacterium lushaniae]
MTSYTSHTGLADLHAERDIRTALALYCRAMDRMDDELALTLFEASATVDYAPDMFTGRARDFVPWVHALHEGFVTTVHRLTTVAIDVRGEHAESEAYGHVLLLQRGGQGEQIRHGYGRYVDQWVLDGGRWLIAHRAYRRDLGYTERINAAPSGGRRDRDDFSYAILSG